MKRYAPAILCLLIFACNQQKDTSGKDAASPEIANDTIPEIRTHIKKEAVASYSEKVVDKDKLNNWKFSVDAYETPETFRYLLKIRYKELDVTDTLTIPNFGIYPVVELKKGRDDLSCIVGFQDKKKEFKDFKMVEVVDGQLKIRSLKSYRRALYRKKQ
ncbi:hypothetical protein DYBT9275_03505 [Dyadobacter sp. CECT 9275]|uniref:Lipoprotein n=1 Tax=Dyadobacter helix TaxID=2822344 RepID=A0A916NCZ7_9BACT|nr:hypothetical protein [Dyadobacter sp. CECT 9275]CAG5005062.1 hypothetical protein DYBT9275_03505 [Dyadobacter sp. CECT 9275]